MEYKFWFDSLPRTQRLRAIGTESERKVHVLEDAGMVAENNHGVFRGLNMSLIVHIASYEFLALVDNWPPAMLRRIAASAPVLSSRTGTAPQHSARRFFEPQRGETKTTSESKVYQDAPRAQFVPELRACVRRHPSGTNWATYIWRSNESATVA